MLMDRVTLKNFRCFRKEQGARLAPLTLLVGENSSGKTSFLAMLRILWDIAYSDRVPDFKDDPYDLGSFDEIAHYRGGRGGRADTIEAGFDVTSGSEGSESYQFTVAFQQKGTVPLPVYIRLDRLDQEIWLEGYFGLKNLEEDQVWQLRFGTSKGDRQRQMPIGLDADRNRMLNYIFLMILQNRNELTPLQGSVQSTAEDWKQIEALIHSFGLFGLQGLISPQRPYAGAPVRSKPRRTYDPARPTRDPEGDYIPMYLADVQNRENWELLKEGLEQFGQTSGLFNEISVKQLGGKASGPFQVQIRKSGRQAKGPPRNLIDMGYGVSQVLPVITELLRGDGPSMFLLQQPEVHLHPSAQAALGSLFCKIAKPDQQLVVETHSDHLIDRVRMDVRDGTTPLTPDDVSILFFEYDDLDVRIHSLELDQEGNIRNAPPSYRQFFMEETRRSLGL